MNCGSQPIASVIISTWCRRALLRRLLFSIARQTVARSVEIIVADSNSPDGTADMLVRYSRRVLPVVTVNTYNALAAKRNAGAAVAHAPLLVFLDDDMRFDDPMSLGQLIQELTAGHGPVCFQVSYPVTWRTKSTYYRFKQLAHERTNRAGGRIEPWRFVAMAFGIREADFALAGGFDDSFKAYGCEDHAFEFSIRSRSIVPALSRSAGILHLEDSRSFRSYRSKLIATAARGMPVLFERWPVARQHSGIAFLEGRFISVVLRIVPSRLIRAAVSVLCRLLDSLPVRTPRMILFPITRLFVAAAYLEGRSLRGRL